MRDPMDVWRERFRVCVKGRKQHSFLSMAVYAGRTSLAPSYAVPVALAVLLTLLRSSLLAEGGSGVIRSNLNTAAFVGSGGCRDCHAKFYELWSTSFHGLAMQPYTPELARKQLTPQREAIAAGKFKFSADINRGVVVEETAGGKTEFPIAHVMGGKNVFYFLTPLERGFLQVLPVAYDVRRKEWIDTTASAMRHFGDRRDEALYWKERPLTFNTSCFGCHVSQMVGNYDVKADSYKTTWAEPGINCETCHGPAGEHVRLFQNLATNQPAPADVKLIVTRTLSTVQRNDMCAPCHAKMSPLTSNFTPGDRYFDHFDLVAMESADFYPDGRDLGENYTYTGWRMNPCVKSGKLDCIHCHTSSGRYRFRDAADANRACLPCHKDKVDDAPAHTRHKPESEGNHCVSCHMPTTEFARMRRSDHSMRPPTPAATLAYNSPNACNICHTNDARWADQKVREWRKRDYQKPVLERAALIVAARKGDWTQLPRMLEYLGRPDREEAQTVSLIRLLANCPLDEKRPVLRSLLQDPSPWVRASAADMLGQRLDELSIAALAKAAGDGFRLVRVRAAGALASVPEKMLPEANRAQVRLAVRELMESMRSRPDDMASRYNLGNIHMSRGEPREAIAEFALASRLQPEALPPYVNAALAHNALGENDKAEASLRQALRLDPTNAAAHLNLGMLLAELDRLEEAEKSFRIAFKSDPRSAQAAYNLGILVSQRDPAEGLEWCERAARISPQEPRYSYTLAFYQCQQGKIGEAALTLEALMKRTSAFPDAYFLLGQIYERQRKTGDALALYRRGAETEALPEAARRELRGRARALGEGNAPPSR